MLQPLSDDEARSLEESLAQLGIPFDTPEEAEKYFFEERDRDLEALQALARQYPELQLDYKAQSLKRLEDFYFRAFVEGKIETRLEKEQFELLLSQYMRQVFVANGMAEWMVFENDFAEGRYELGILYGYGAGGSEHYARDLDQKEENRREFLYHQFMMYVPEERIDSVQ